MTCPHAQTLVHLCCSTTRMCERRQSRSGPPHTASSAQESTPCIVCSTCVHGRVRPWLSAVARQHKSERAQRSQCKQASRTGPNREGVNRPLQHDSLFSAKPAIERNGTRRERRRHGETQEKGARKNSRERVHSTVHEEGRPADRRTEAGRRIRNRARAAQCDGRHRACVRGPRVPGKGTCL